MAPRPIQNVYEFLDLLEPTDKSEGYTGNSLHIIYSIWRREFKPNEKTLISDNKFIAKLKERFENIVKSTTTRSFFNVSINEEILKNDAVKQAANINLIKYEYEENVDFMNIINQTLSIEDFDKFVLEECENSETICYSKISIYRMFLEWAKTHTKNNRTLTSAYFITKILPKSNYLPDPIKNQKGSISADLIPISCKNYSKTEGVITRNLNGDVNVEEKEEPKMKTSVMEKYNNHTDRRFSDPHTHGDSDTITAFIEKRNYGLRFGKKNWVRFVDVFNDYMDFCNESIYIPVSRTFFQKYLEDTTYTVDKIHGGRYLYINMGPKDGSYPGSKPAPEPEVIDTTNNVIELPLDPVPFEGAEIETSVTVEEAEPIKEEVKTKIDKPNISDEEFIRIDNFIRDNFINRYCNYATYNTFNLKKLYASMRYYTGNTSISYEEFSYVISRIPAARINIPTFGSEVGKIFSCLVPEYCHLKFLRDKSGFRLTNYDEKIKKAEQGTLEIFKSLCKQENEKEEDKKEENIKESETKVEEPALIKVEQVEEPKVKKEEKKEEEVSKVNKEQQQNNPAINAVEAAMTKIEKEYADVFVKYKTLADIRAIIADGRNEVHEELQFVFDMAVQEIINKLDSMDANTIILAKTSLETKLKSLASFTKK